MPLTVDSPVLGPGPRVPSRAMMLTLSEELYEDIRVALLAERDAIAADGSHQPPPAVEFDWTGQQSATEKSPGNLYIGGQALKLLGNAERIFDLYAQPHVPNNAPNSNPLRLHAIVSQNLKAQPARLSDTLVERVHNQTHAEQQDRQKRGVVLIDSPAAQLGAKKRKLASGAQSRSPATAVARPGTTARPISSTPKTLSGPPLSAQSLARQAAKHQVSASASDSSSSSSQPLASQPAPPRPSNAKVNLPISQLNASNTPPAKAIPPTTITDSKPSSSASSAPPNTTPLDITRDPAEGWKTSSFKGGIRAPGPTKSKTTKGGTTGTTTKAKTVKSNPIISDELDDLLGPPVPPPRKASAATVPDAAPVTKANRINGGTTKAGTKRPRASTTNDDIWTAEADLLAAVEVPAPRRSATRAVGLEAELDAAAAVSSAGTTGRKTTGPNGLSNSTTAVKRSRLSNLDDVLLDAASANTAPLPKPANNAPPVKVKLKLKAPKPNHDDEDFDIREERRQAKKSVTGRASLPSSSAPAAPVASTSTSTNVKHRKSSAMPESIGQDIAPARVNGTSAAARPVVSKQRPPARDGTPITNGTSNGNTRLDASRSNPVPTRNVSAGANGAPTLAGSQRSNASKPARRTSPQYTDTDEDEPPAKVIPKVPKVKPHLPKPPSNASVGPVPPSPVSQTASNSTKNSRTTSSSTPSTAPNATTTGGRVVTPSDTVPSPAKKRKRFEIEDRNTDAVIASPLPHSHEALREHYDSCYVTYIGLWGRIRAETTRQKKLLKRSTVSDGEIDDVSSVDGGSGGENVEALQNRYGRLHERLQTIRTTLGAS